MCQVHNPVGSLTVIKTHLHQHNLYEYKSLNELIHFQKAYSVTRQEMISNHRFLVEQEKVSLTQKIDQLDSSIKAKKRAAAKQLLPEIAALKTRLRSNPLSRPQNSFGQLSEP